MTASNRRPSRLRRIAAATLSTLAVQFALAQTATFDLPAQPLEQALAQFSRQAGLQLAASPELLRGLHGQAVAGPLDVRAALAELLRGSGLQGRIADGLLTVERASPAASAETTLAAVPVKASAEQETAVGPVAGYAAKRSAAGTKTDTPIVETPQSISVVTAERIEAIGVTRVNDALGYTPGVSTTTYGVDSRFDWISLRGFDAYSPGFYLDGLPLRNISTWALWKTETYGAERIELLRGPASVLYGQSGPGGVVNVVSKRPTAEPLHELQLQLGDHRRRQVAGDFAGALDAQGRLLYRITALARDAELPAGHMPDDRVYIAPALTWHASADTTLTVLSHYSRTRAGSYVRNRPAIGSLVPTPAGTTIPASLYTGEPSFNRFHQDQWALGYLLEHRLDERWTLRQNLRYGKLDVDYRQLTGGRYIPVNDDPTDPANYRTIRRSVFTSDEQVKALVLDNQLQGRLQWGEWQHTLLVGLDHQRSRFDQVTASGEGPSFDLGAPVYGQAVTLPAPYADAITTVTQTGLYVQDQLRWGERWVATLGGRYDRAAARIDSRLDGSRTRVPDTKFTRRAGLVHLHPSGWAPYLGYSESFMPTAAIDPATGRPLEPETGRQFEAGVRYQPPGRRDSYSAAVFDLRRRNYITYDATFAPHQTGEVRVRGLELEATTRPLPQLNLTAAYAWTPKADVTASVNAAEIGKQLTAVPRHRLSLWTDYRFGFGLKLGLGARHTGSNRGDGEVAPAQVPASTVFDALVAYDIGRWSLALNLRNLSDKTYFANCDAYGSCYYGEPRRATATATLRW
jgi:iron complex outermembrane receptor protein